MPTRISLHNKLLEILPNVYYQPPSDIRMVYPCITYYRVRPKTVYADDRIYSKHEEYQIMVLDQKADNTYADDIVEAFRYSSIDSNFIMNNLHHTKITLYY